MMTLVLQGVIAAGMLVFAGLGVAIGRRLPDRAGVFRSTWILTAITFGFYAVIMSVQAVAAVGAFKAGPGHLFFEWYMGFSPMANHSRTFLCWPFYFILGLVAWRGSLSEAGLRWSFVAVAGGAVLGAAYGRWEGALDSTIHLPTTAIIDSVGFLFLGALLIASLIRDTLDRHLWAILAIHGLRSAIAAIFLTAMSWLDVGNGWTPVPWHLAALRLVFVLAMIALAANRLFRASRGDLGRSMVVAAPRDGMLLHQPGPAVGRR